MFYLAGALPEDVVARFNRDAAPSLRTLQTEEIQGWVGGRHLLDLPITEENAYHAGFLRLHLMQAVRKIPPSLFRAECLMEELAMQQAEQLAVLPRKLRTEIRRGVTERLLPQMPPILKGIPFITGPKDGVVYAGALSDKQMDAFRLTFSHTTGVELIPVTPETAAAKRSRVDTREWFKTSFSPKVPDAEVSESPGLDFLTWLWFVVEARGGILKDPELGEFGVMIEGPLLFAMEGAGAHETVLRKGEPMISTEAKACLLAGKKLRRARLVFARDQAVWKTTIDAEAFVFRGLKLPELEEKLDIISVFQDRMDKLDQFRDMLFRLYDRFVAERRDEAVWKDTLQAIHQWVSARKSRN
jgi:hypothetical protein